MCGCEIPAWKFSLKFLGLTRSGQTLLSLRNDLGGCLLTQYQSGFCFQMSPAVQTILSHLLSIPGDDPETTRRRPGSPNRLPPPHECWDNRYAVRCLTQCRPSRLSQKPGLQMWLTLYVISERTQGLARLLCKHSYGDKSGENS